MAETLEYRVLLECSDHLVTALKFDPISLGIELAAKGLVPPRDVSHQRTSAEQAHELAGNILDRVKLAPSRYRDFVEILSRHLWMKDFIKTLETAYCRKSETDDINSMRKDSGHKDQDTESDSDDFSCDLADIPQLKSSFEVSNPIVRFSDLDEDDREDLLAQIDEQTKKIELEFGKLVDKVFTSFRDSGVDHNRLILTLIGKEKLFKEDELEGIKNIYEVFKIIRPYCSYFNYDVLETLVQTHGSRQAKTHFKKYIQAFSAYCKAIPCVEEICGNHDTKSKRTKLKFKLDFDRQQLKPDAVRSIKRKIAKHLGMRPSALYLCGIEEGCVLLEFLVPSFIVQHLFPLSDAQKFALQRDVKALSVECETLNMNIKLNLKPASKKASSHTGNSNQSSEAVHSPYKFIHWMKQTLASRKKNREIQLGRKLRRTFSRDPEAVLQRYVHQDPSPQHYDIQGTDTPPIVYTGPDSTCVPNHGNLYNISQASGVSGVSSYSGMSGVSQNHGPHKMPQFGDPAYLGLPPGTNYPDHHSASSRRTSDTSGSIHSGYSNGHQVPYYPTAIHSSHNVINHQPQGSHPDSTSLPGFQYVLGGYPTPPHIASREIPQQILVDPLSSVPILPHPNGTYVAYPQLAASQPIPTVRSERAHSTLSNHSGHSHKSSGRQSPASTHGQYVQHPSPHIQPISFHPPQSHLISQNDLATVHLALMHNRHCQIPGCCCQRVRELVEASRGRMPYDSPEMSISSSGSGNSSRVYRVSHQASSTDSDSDYSSYNDRRSRPPNLRLLSDEHNRNPNLHPHYHLTTKSHMRRVSVHAPVDHRRSKSLSDLTPLTEVPETPAKTPAIGGSVKAGTPVYYCQPALGEDGREQPTSPDDCHCTNQPMLLREISISADNIPALCLNDCPFTPSPLKEGCRMLAVTPGRRKGSFRRGSMRSTKPKLKTVKEKNSSGESDDSNTSSRSNTPIKSSQSDDEGIDVQSHHSQEHKSSSLHKHTKTSTDTTLTKVPVDTTHKTLVDSTPKSSLGIESSQYDRSSDDEVKEIMQSAPARDIQKTAPNLSPLLGRKNDSINSSYLLSNSNAMSDPRMRRSTSPLSIGSASQVSVHSRRSASPYETEIRKQNGVITEITEC